MGIPPCARRNAGSARSAIAKARSGLSCSLGRDPKYISSLYSLDQAVTHSGSVESSRRIKDEPSRGECSVLEPDEVVQHFELSCWTQHPGSAIDVGATDLSGAIQVSGCVGGQATVGVCAVGSGEIVQDGESAGA